jgi:hypothetical protein
MRATASTSTPGSGFSTRSTAASSQPIVDLSDGRVDPAFGWIAKDYLGIDQGPILAMICNYRNQLVWDDMRNCVPLRRGLARAGVHRRLARPGGVMPEAGAPADGRGRPQRDPADRLGERWRLVGALAGCGRRSDGPGGPLDFWAMGREAEVVVELLARFRERHPDVPVRGPAAARGRRRTRSS